MMKSRRLLRRPSMEVDRCQLLNIIRSKPKLRLKRKRSKKKSKENNSSNKHRRRGKELINSKQNRWKKSPNRKKKRESRLK